MRKAFRIIVLCIAVAGACNATNFSCAASRSVVLSNPVQEDQYEQNISEDETEDPERQERIQHTRKILSNPEKYINNQKYKSVVEYCTEFLEAEEFNEDEKALMNKLIHYCTALSILDISSHKKTDCKSNAGQFAIALKHLKQCDGYGISAKLRKQLIERCRKNGLAFLWRNAEESLLGEKMGFWYVAKESEILDNLKDMMVDVGFTKTKGSPLTLKNIKYNVQCRIVDFDDKWQPCVEYIGTASYKNWKRIKLYHTTKKGKIKDKTQCGYLELKKQNFLDMNSLPILEADSEKYEVYAESKDGVWSENYYTRRERASDNDSGSYKKKNYDSKEEGNEKHYSVEVCSHCGGLGRIKSGKECKWCSGTGSIYTEYD